MAPCKPRSVVTGRGFFLRLVSALGISKKPRYADGMQLLLLDRDGVINHDSENYIRSLADWRPIDGSVEAIARASQNGFRVAVVTNQSGLARGYFDEATLAEIHNELRQRVAALGGTISDIIYCPHGPDDGCDCRKPAPGMVLELLSRFNSGAENAVMVGDSLRDLQAADRAGVQPILVRTGNGEKTAAVGQLPAKTKVFADLAAVVDDLLAKQRAVQ